MSRLAFVPLVTASSPYIVNLDTANFTDFIAREKNVLVEFYAPWCGFCKQLEPIFENAAETLNGLGYKVAKVDATAEPDLTYEHGVQGFPSLQFFSDGDNLGDEYSGERQAESIIEYVKDRAGAVLSAERTVDKSSSLPVLTVKTGKVTPFFESFAKFYRDKFQFLTTIDGGASNVTLEVKHKDEVPRSYRLPVPDDLTEDSLSVCFNDAVFPMFGELSPNSYPDYNTRGKGIAWIILPKPDKKTKVYSVYESIADMMREYAARFQEFSFTYVDTIKFGEAIKILVGISKEDLPAIVLQVSAEAHLKYIYKGPLDKENLDVFFQNYEDGKLLPDIKSEEIPPEEEAVINNVYIGVGKSLHSLMLDPDRDVLLFVHAPWCIQCNVVHEIWDKFGAKIQKEGVDDLLRVVKVNGMENDSPFKTLKWSAFPMIYHSRAGGTEEDIKNVDIAREPKALWRYIRDNHSKKLEFLERGTLAQKNAGKAEL